MAGDFVIPIRKVNPAECSIWPISYEIWFGFWLGLILTIILTLNAGRLGCHGHAIYVQDVQPLANSMHFVFEE